MRELLSKLGLTAGLLGVLVLIVILMKTCDGGKTDPVSTVKIGGKKYEVVKDKIDTIIVPHTVTVYKRGKDVYRDTVIYVQVPAIVDTLSIVREYHAKRVYSDTLKLSDSLGYVVVRDTIAKNQLISRQWNAKVNKITVKETLTVKELPRNQIYIGLVGGFDRVNVVNYAGPSLLLKNKKDQVYSVGIGYSADKTVSVQGAMYWKIKLKK